MRKNDFRRYHERTRHVTHVCLTYQIYLTFFMSVEMRLTGMWNLYNIIDTQHYKFYDCYH